MKTDPFALLNAALHRVDDRFLITADRSFCLGPPGHKHMSGGASFAVLLSALEQVTERPVINATAQFLGTPQVGERAIIDTEPLFVGKSVTQATATMSVGDKAVVRVNATLGLSRDTVGRWQWERMPGVSGPLHCPRLAFIRKDDGDLHSHLDIRVAQQNAHGLSFWVHRPGGQPWTAQHLALVADYLPESVHGSIGRRAGATSLDNMIRMVSVQESEWALCVTRLHAVSAGLFHGSMNLFAEDGTLMAVAGQSGVVRLI